MKRKRRNRRKTRKLQATVRVPALLSVILVPTFVISLVWILAGDRCEALGREIRVLEAQKDLLSKQLENEQNRWANLTAPSSFRQVLSQHGLVMSRPDERSVVRIQGSVGMSVVRATSSQNAAYYE